MNRSLRIGLPGALAVLLGALATPLHAQGAPAAVAAPAAEAPAVAPAAPSAPTATATAEYPGALCLRANVEAAGIDPEQLRQHIAQELGLNVLRVDVDAAPCLRVEAQSLSALQVAFVRADGTRIERTLDASTTGAHAVTTIALLAANLVRDEAAELLAQLQQQAAPPAAAALPAPAPLAPPPSAERSEPRQRSGCDPNELRRVVVGADVLPLIGSTMAQGTEVERRLSFNLFGSVTSSVRGFELAGLFNIETHGLCGVQIAGIANTVMGPVGGAQFALVNVAHGRLDGAQFGLVGVATGAVEGAQLGLVNVGGALHGAQVGLANLAAGERDGVQIGLANVTNGAAQGAQIGLLNVGAELQGAQLGLANISSGHVRGAMVGLLNVAEDADAPIGLASILWRGRTHLDVFGTDAGLMMLGIEHGGEHVHNVYSAGGTVRDGKGVFAFSYGIGARLFEDARVMVDLDAMGFGLLAHNSRLDRLDIATIGQLRIPVSLRLARGVALFVGPAMNVSVAQADGDLADPALYSSARLTPSEADLVVRLWPGFTAGARFF